MHAEQGLGDTMMFVRFLSAVRKPGGRVLFESQPSLVPLLKASGIDEVYAAGNELPPYDVYLPLLNLPSVLGVTAENLAGATPYLAADPRLAEQWRDKLSNGKGLRVGIAWQGNPEYAFDRIRSIPLDQYAPLAKVEGVRLINLQKSAAEQSLIEQAARATVNFAIEDLGPGLDEASGAVMDTAAVMKNLDLVITSDTATAHLAGALGVPVWVALSRIARLALVRGAGGFTLVSHDAIVSPAIGRRLEHAVRRHGAAINGARRGTCGRMMFL